MIIKISEKLKKQKINDPKKIANILTKVLKCENEFDRAKEHFWGIYLNSRNIIKRIELIHLGTADSSIIHPREIFRPAIKLSATQIIVSHNHPSGNSEVSEADIAITQRIKKAGEILGITLIDHLIITEQNNFYSFKDNKLL